MLIEVRWYSPTDYDIHHYGLVEADDYDQATAKLKAKGVSLRMGPDPMSYAKVVNPTSHKWGKGFSMGAGDFKRRLA